MKQVFLKMSQNLQESICVRASFLMKFQPEDCNFIKKEILLEVLSWKWILETFKNTCFTEHLLANAPEERLSLLNMNKPAVNCKFIVI